MDWFLLVIGIAWDGVVLASVLRWAFSRRHRRMMADSKDPHWLFLVVLLPAVAFTAAGVAPSLPRWVATASMVPLVAAGVWLRRKHRGRDDLPPYVVRIEALPLNPLVLLRHPIRSLRADWEAFGHPLRSRRETQAWLAHRVQQEDQNHPDDS